MNHVCWENGERQVILLKPGMRVQKRSKRSTAGEYDIISSRTSWPDGVCVCVCVFLKAGVLITVTPALRNRCGSAAPRLH